MVFVQMPVICFEVHGIICSCYIGRECVSGNIVFCTAACKRKAALGTEISDETKRDVISNGLTGERKAV